MCSGRSDRETGATAWSFLHVGFCWIGLGFFFKSLSFLDYQRQNVTDTTIKAGLDGTWKKPGLVESVPAMAGLGLGEI